MVMSDANIAINYDFNALLAAHQASGADVTVAYQKTQISPRAEQIRQQPAWDLDRLDAVTAAGRPSCCSRQTTAPAFIEPGPEHPVRCWRRETLLQAGQVDASLPAA